MGARFEALKAAAWRRHLARSVLVAAWAQLLWAVVLAVVVAFIVCSLVVFFLLTGTTLHPPRGAVKEEPGLILRPSKSLCPSLDTRVSSPALCRLRTRERASPRLGRPSLCCGADRKSTRLNS